MCVTQTQKPREVIRLSEQVLPSVEHCIFTTSMHVITCTANRQRHKYYYMTEYYMLFMNCKHFNPIEPSCNIGCRFKQCYSYGSTIKVGFNGLNHIQNNMVVPWMAARMPYSVHIFFLGIREGYESYILL